MAQRSGDLRAIVVVSRNVVLADWLFTAPAQMGCGVAPHRAQL